MTTGKALNGKPYAGNPHVRFDEGEVASAATSRRGSLLYKKIAIVGVDGSGKTVLMTALGDKYENPDEFGLFLSPENSDAFGYVKLQMDRMRRGMWPGSTIAGKSSILEWGFFRKYKGNNSRLCDLSFLDFSGEVYRMAFGSKSDHNAASYDDDEIAPSINELRQHIKEADTLAVLINLKDIISGNVSNARTREAMWLSKSILDYATRELHTPNIALVFTQADAYRSTITECGGVRGAYEKYLPHVANIYPDIRILSVSAVNKTSPDENGIPCPVDGFQSEGLDDLMEWIVSSVPGCETLISDIRQAPARCRDRAWAIRDEYISALDDDDAIRHKLLDQMADAIRDMDAAMRAYPYALPSGAQGLLQDELRDMCNFDAAYAQLGEEIPQMTMDQIRQGVEELCRGSSFAGKVKSEVERSLLAIRDAVLASAARKKRKIQLAVVFFLLALGVLSVCVCLFVKKIDNDRVAELKRQEMDRQREEQRLAAEAQAAREREAEENRRLAAEAESSKAKIARGWSYEMRKGHKIAVWKPGEYHSQTRDLKADHQEDQWISTKPGYVWTGGTKIEWRKGQTSSQYPHWVTIDRKDRWILEDGYKAENPNGTYVAEKGAAWNPSWVSSDGNKRATSQEGVFEHKVYCSSCSGSGKKSGKRTCGNCNGSKRVSSSKTCSRCDGSGRIDEENKCSRCGGDGACERSCPDCGIVRDGYGNVVSYHGQVCDNCGGKGQVAYRGNGGLGDALRIAGMQLQGQQPMTACGKCGGNGWFHHSTCGQSGKLRETCSRCDGSGRISSSRNCWKCDGSGRVSESGRCSYCDSNGQVDGSVDCSNCNGSGRVWR